MRILVYIIFFCLFTASSYADVSEFVNVNKISNISKELVEKQHNVAAHDLQVDFISTMGSSNADFVQVEVHLYQISSKTKLTTDEIEKLVPKEIKLDHYNHYKVAGFVVNFSSNNIGGGLVTKTIGTIDEPKKP